MSLLNNRELAALIWISLLLGWALTNPEIRKSLINVLQHALTRPLIKIYAVMLAYIMAMLLLLSRIGLWDTNQLKATIVWIFSIALISLFRAKNIHKETDYFKKSVRDNINLIVVLEFIINFYNFSIWIELTLLPALTFLGMLKAFSENKQEYQPVKKLLENFFIAFGSIILIYALYRLLNGFTQFATLNNLADLYTPPLLSILFLPFPYGLSIFLAYERAFVILRRNSADDVLYTYAKRTAMHRFCLKTHALERWIDRSYIERLTSKDMVNRSIRDIYEQLTVEKNPPSVDSALGWSPYRAKDFLSEYGLTTDYYRNFGNDKWSCSSPSIDLDNSLFPNTLSYSVFGNRSVAKSLKLQLSVDSPSLKDEAMEHFTQVSKELLSKALEAEASANLRELINSEQDTNTSINGKRVSIIRKDWIHSQEGQFELTFMIAAESE